MNTLIDPVKRIARDLVEKKLWPVAVLLLVALVAVPVLIGGSSAEEAPAPAALSANAPAQNSRSLLTVVDESTVDGSETRAGKLDDPFYDPPEPPAAESTVGATASVGAPAASTEGSTGGGTPATGESTETTPAQPAETVSAPTYYSTVVRWWETKPGDPYPIRRLTPFGGLSNTAAQYLGVTKSNGHYAVFVLGANATSDGEAKCEDVGCRVFGLKSGQTQLVTVQPPDGGEARQYNLYVASVKSHTADAATARTMRGRVHADGADVLTVMRENSTTRDALKGIRYDRDSGLLVKSATPTDAAATAAQPAE